MRQASSFRSALAAAAVFAAAAPAFAYPPAVGVLGKSRSCLTCHASDGPWSDEAKTIVDVLDAKTKTSLRGADGAIRIEVPRGEMRTVLTVIGRQKGDGAIPKRNAWLYVDPATIETASLSKFAPGWDVNLPGSCRLVGDKLDGYDGLPVTSLPMTVRPMDGARDSEIELQVMLTAGESVKGKGKEGIVANYLVRKVVLKVVDR